jgi:hypothetical protein
MCMFSRPVESVSKTKLIHMTMQDRVSGQRWVMQTYANSVKIKAGQEQTTMILPVPAMATDIRLLNKENDKTVQEVFEHLHQCFERQEHPPKKSKFVSRSMQQPVIEVIQSGAYQVSIVPTLADLVRLDATVFDAASLQPLTTILQKLVAKRHFSFLVCKLKATAVAQPFVYAYKADGADAFIPTKHYHGGAEEEEYADDWDHEIMVIGSSAQCGWKSTKLVQEYDAGRLVALMGANNNYTVDGKSVHRIKVKGTEVNEDIEFPSSELGKELRERMIQAKKEYEEFMAQQEQEEDNNREEKRKKKISNKAAAAAAAALIVE